MKNTLIITLLTFSLITTSYSQSIFKAPPSYISLSMGFSVKDDLLPESFEYSPITFLAAIPVWQKSRWTIYSEIQFAQTLEVSNSELEFSKDLQRPLPRSDVEIGLNFGVSYTQPLFYKLKLTAAIGTGPHFISLNTSRQAHGFLFSDNIELGLAYPVSKMIDVNLKARYRHISNAGFKDPNGGIENLFFVLGITQFLF